MQKNRFLSVTMIKDYLRDCSLFNTMFTIANIIKGIVF